MFLGEHLFRGNDFDQYEKYAGVYFYTALTTYLISRLYVVPNW